VLAHVEERLRDPDRRAAAPAAAAPGKAIDLMEALKASLAPANGANGAGKRNGAEAPSAAARAAGPAEANGEPTGDADGAEVGANGAKAQGGRKKATRKPREPAASGAKPGRDGASRG